MKISLYTALRNCIRQDYPFIEMLRHHLELVDEIVINEGYSVDGTFEAISNLDPRIKIVRSHWDKPTGEDWWIHFKDRARLACTGDWCIHLDCDEFIPEWEFGPLREFLESTSASLVPCRFFNFYGNYRVYYPRPHEVNWITHKMIIHRNIPDIEFWGDGSNVKLKGQHFAWNTSEQTFTVHHFGSVRKAARLRESHWLAGRFRSGRSIKLKPPSFVFDLFPYDWFDKDYLSNLCVYDGPLISPVREQPARFVRDNMRLYKHLAGRSEDITAEVRGRV